MAGDIPNTPGSAGGAGGSTDFGTAGDLREELRAATEGPSGQDQQAPPGPGGPPARQPPGPPQAPDAQPTPNIPQVAQQQMQDPFSDQRAHPDKPWREALALMARHPQASRHLKYLAELAQMDQPGGNARTA